MASFMEEVLVSLPVNVKKSSIKILPKRQVQYRIFEKIKKDD